MYRIRIEKLIRKYLKISYKSKCKKNDKEQEWITNIQVTSFLGFVFIDKFLNYSIIKICK